MEQTGLDARLHTHSGASGDMATSADAHRTGLDARLHAFVADFGGVAGSVHVVHGDDLLLSAGVNLPGPLRAAVAEIPRGKGMAGTAWLRGSPVQTCDIKTDTAGGVVRPGARAVGAGAAVALPVRDANGAVVAVVGIAFDDEREIPGSEVDALAAGAAALLAKSNHQVLESMCRRAESWLLARQHPSGAWTLPLRADAPTSSVAMTVLAMTALRGGDSGSGFGSGRDSGSGSDNAARADALARGLTWLADRQNADGSFGDGPDGAFYRPYCTALALWVLPGSSPRYTMPLARALDYLRGNQRQDGLDRGGIGFGMVAPAPTPQDPAATFTRTFAMISPTSMAAEAAWRVGLPPDDPFLRGIADYVRSCQNDSSINTRPDVLRFLADNGFELRGDGGIVATLENLRRPAPRTAASSTSATSATSAAEPVISTGISTYQGMSAYLRAGLAADSPEVLAALRWIRSHYSVTEHAGFAEVTRAGQRPVWPTEHGAPDAASRPVSDTRPDDIGQAGRILYLFAMAQALSCADIEMIETPDGARHAWDAEIAEELFAAQRPEGCWINPNPRWLESDAVLSTAFALATINILIRRRATGVA